MEKNKPKNMSLVNSLSAVFISLILSMTLLVFPVKAQTLTQTSTLIIAPQTTAQQVIAPQPITAPAAVAPTAETTAVPTSVAPVLSTNTSTSTSMSKPESTNVSAITATKSESSGANRTYKGDVAFILMGRRLDDQIVNSRFSRLIIAMSLTATYRDWLIAKLGVVQLLTSGQASNLYAVSEGAPSSGTLVDEANLRINLANSNWVVSAAAGIIPANLSPIFSNMLGQSNAGGSLVSGYKNNGTEALVSVEQSIPTSKSNSNRVIDENTLPLLTVGSLRGSLPIESTGSKIKASVSRFIFTDLSSQSAADSSTIGSTTTGNGKGGYLFAYEYRGIESALILEQNLFLADKLVLKGAAIKNELAPAGANSGWTVKAEYKKGFNKFDLIPSVVRFRMESDAIPAAYGQSGIFTNRAGTGLGLKLDVPRENFNVFAGYTQAEVINTNTTASVYQSDRQTYTLGAEAKYDIF